MSDLAVEARELSKTYGEGQTAVYALRSIDIDIPRGEFVVLLGASGSGKTTFLNQVGALESPTSGTITVDGRDLAGLSEAERTDYRRNRIGFVFQFYNLIPTLTAMENVELIAELTGPDATERSRVALEHVGLSGRLDHYPGQLSGGQQQRVSIARGLVKDPPLLLADEPTGALDVGSGTEILTLLRSMVDGTDRTVLFVTHNGDISRIAHRVIELRDGEITNVHEQPDPPSPAVLAW